MQVLLIKLRKEANESQLDVANMLGLSEGSYRNRERGKIQFKMNEMFILAKHYNKRIDEIFLPREFTIRVQSSSA